MMKVKRWQRKITLKSLGARKPKDRQTKLAKKSLKIQKGNHNLYIEEDRATQQLKVKAQKNKQRSTKHTHKTKVRVTQAPLNIGVNQGAPIGKDVPAPLVAPVVLIQLKTYNQ